MPGYLGSQSHFKSNVANVVHRARSIGATAVQHGEATAKLQALHRQVLPFVLRRLKSRVLKDLPPKIMQVGCPAVCVVASQCSVHCDTMRIQDVYCDLTPMQAQLYKAGGKLPPSLVSLSQASTKKRHVAPSSSESKQPVPAPQLAPAASRHVFHTLHYLRQVCNHPALVNRRTRPKKRRRDDSVFERDDRPHFSFAPACKLHALRELLLQCGIGGAPSSHIAAVDGAEAPALEDNGASSSRALDVEDGAEDGTAKMVSRSLKYSAAASPHRVLVFSQVRSEQCCMFRVQAPHGEPWATVSSLHPR